MALLQLYSNVFSISRDGGIGRRTGLKIPRWRQRGGSIPPPGTTMLFQVTSKCILSLENSTF